MLGKLQRLGRWVLRIYSIFWQVKVIALKNVAILGSGNARTNRVKFNTTSALARAKARSSHSGFCIGCPLPTVKGEGVGGLVRLYFGFCKPNSFRIKDDFADFL